MNSVGWSEKYRGWLENLLNLKKCGDCPCFGLAHSAVKHGIIPRAGAGCVRNPKLVIVGIRPGDAHPVEALFYKRALNNKGDEDSLREVKEAWDSIYFPENHLAKFVARRGTYVREVRDLLDEICEKAGNDLKGRVYITNAVKCQRGGFEGPNCYDARVLFRFCGKYLREELEAIEVDFQRAIFLVLGLSLEKELSEFFKELGVQKPLFFAPHPRAGGHYKKWKSSEGKHEGKGLNELEKLLCQ